MIGVALAVRPEDVERAAEIPGPADSLAFAAATRLSSIAYTVYMPKGSSAGSTVLTLRVTPDLGRRLARAARSSRRTRSETARAILEGALASGAPVEDPAVEARRQSQLASSRVSEHDVLKFIATAADLRGWK